MANSVNLDKFYQDNEDRITGIANANNVDTGVARAMLISNIRGDTNYAGGGVADMGQLAKDYQAAITADRAANSNYFDAMSNLAQQNYNAQQKAINRQTANTISQINEQRRLARQAYEQQQKENYIQNELSKNQMGDYLAAMGYSGGMAESTLANLNNQYINNRIAAQDKYNNALAQLDQLIEEAYLNGDQELAAVAQNYYAQLMNALGQQEQYDYNRQLQLEGYAREDAQALEDNNYKMFQLYLNGLISPEQARTALSGSRYESLVNGTPYAMTMANQSSGSSRGGRRSSGGGSTSGGGSETTPDDLLGAYLTGGNRDSSWQLNNDFAEDLAAAVDGTLSILDILNNEEIIARYGMDRYNQLLSAAQERYIRSRNA